MKSIEAILENDFGDYAIESKGKGAEEEKDFGAMFCKHRATISEKRSKKVRKRSPGYP